MATIPWHMQVTHEGSREDSVFAEPAPDFVDTVLQLLPAHAAGFIAEYIQLYRVIAWDQVDGSNTDGSDWRFPTVPVCQQQPGSLGDLHRALAGIAHLHLILVSAQVIAADIQRTPLAARP